MILERWFLNLLNLIFWLVLEKMVCVRGYLQGPILIPFYKSLSFEKLGLRSTLRHLLCYTSGFAYSAASEKIQKWAKFEDHNTDLYQKSLKTYIHPLIFEPGKGSSYGPV